MKTVVITGAGGVLCGTLAIALAKQGYQIALLDLKKEAAVRGHKIVTNNFTCTHPSHSLLLSP